MTIAIKILDEKMRDIREQAERDIAELLRAKEALLKLPLKPESKEVVKVVKKESGGGPRKPAAAVAATQGSWKGVRLTDAIDVYLNSVNRPVKFTALKKALEERGVRLGDPDKPRRYAANLKTAIINNRKKFVYDKDTDKVSLAAEDAVAASA